MTTILLITILAGVVATVCVLLHAVTVRPALQPAVAGPFAPGSLDPAADTLTSQAQVSTVFADPEWQTATLDRLCDVETLLDYLEAHAVSDREFHVLGNSSFCVRWK
jgi:hypothetical protein